MRHSPGDHGIAPKHLQRRVCARSEAVALVAPRMVSCRPVASLQSEHRSVGLQLWVRKAISYVFVRLRSGQRRTRDAQEAHERRSLCAAACLGGEKQKRWRATCHRFVVGFVLTLSCSFCRSVPQEPEGQMCVEGNFWQNKSAYIIDDVRASYALYHKNQPTPCV